MHMWEGLIRFGLCLLPWFTFWFGAFKCLCRFLRDEQTELAELYNDEGLEGHDTSSYSTFHQLAVG